MNSGVSVSAGRETAAEGQELHLAALASLKGDVVELNQRLLQSARERDTLEKRLAEAQLISLESRQERHIWMSLTCLLQRSGLVSSPLGSETGSICPQFIFL
ncbi:Colorectal mutant cancer protein [Triplophysa tibetana]|uniref:Colorectal mutant cancer protein n=1 Tax=Triplophysa tibetana TaxID=1572043 RepID=A0A5A9P9C9_9TELE|nr:Colorectal mutant cancer protein [Triplophysa tibetana]